MTTKEKAIELVDLMHNTSHCEGKHFPNNNYCECSEINFFQAKQCALICVDEMIKKLVELSDGKFTFLHDVMYYQEVKQEIQKL